MIRKWQSDYFEEKKKEIEERKKIKEEKKQRNNVSSKPEKKIDFPKGAVVHFTGIKEGQCLTREEIKEKIKEVADLNCSFVDFKKGDLEGYVRLGAENLANELFKKLDDGKLKIGDIELSVRVLEGDEEEEFLKKTVDSVTKQREKSKKNRKRRGNFGGDGPKSKSRR